MASERWTWTYSTAHRSRSSLHFALARAEKSGGRMPPRVGPQLAADGGVGDHEADGVGDLFGLDQPAQLRVGQYRLLDQILTHRPHHRRVGESRVDDAAADAVEHRLFHQREGDAFEPALRGGVRDLALVPLRRDGAD